MAKLVVGEAVFTPPWGVAVPGGRLSFYGVRAGCCQMVLGGSAATHFLEAGDLVLLAGGTEHSLCDQPASEAIRWPIETPVQRAPVTDDPGRPDGCALVYGHATLEPIVGDLFKQYLPDLIRVNQGESELLKAADPLFDMILDECRSDAGGFQSIAEHLVQIVIVQTIRSHMFAGGTKSFEGESDRRATVLRASADPRIRLILDAIHARPGDPWTVVGMAKRAGMSKSAFSERFSQIVGRPPMQYVTDIRLDEACDMLSGTDFAIHQIAALLGYGSASSFSNAFRRELGTSPMAYRDDRERDSTASSAARARRSARAETAVPRQPPR